MHALIVMLNAIFVMDLLLQIVFHVYRIIIFLMIRLNASVDLVLQDMAHNILVIPEDAMM